MVFEKNRCSLENCITEAHSERRQTLGMYTITEIYWQQDGKRLNGCLSRVLWNVEQCIERTGSEAGQFGEWMSGYA